MRIFAPVKTQRFTEIYYDDAQRLAVYLANRDGCEIEIINGSSEYFPLPPKMKDLPEMVNAFRVGDYEIAYLDKRPYPEKDLKYRNRNLHRVMMGERIRFAREEKGMSLEQLEILTGIKAKNLENIELGRYDASIDVLSNIGEALGCHLDFVLD